MSNHLPYSEEEHHARLVCGDPVAQAYEWIRAYSENLSAKAAGEDSEYYNNDPVTIDELIETGLMAIDDSDPFSWASIVRGGAFEGQGTDPMFWEMLAILKGIDIPTEKRTNFFSCSC